MTTRTIALPAVILLSLAGLKAEFPPELLLTVHAGDYHRTDCPVCTTLPPDFAGKSLALSELTNITLQVGPIQGAGSEARWLLGGKTVAGSERSFRLSVTETDPSAPALAARKNVKQLTLSQGYRQLLTDSYRQDTTFPPQVTVANENGLAGKRILLYTKNGKGFVHDNIPASIEAIKKLGRENDFTVVASEDPSLFNADSLGGYDVLVFSNTNNELFDTPEQKGAFKNYIAAGGGFVAIHSACGSEREWPWFWRNLGGKFFRHAKRQDFDVTVVDAEHPSTYFLPGTWHIKDDECYYLKQLNPAIHVLLAADLNTVDDEQGSTGYPSDTFGSNFPTSWCHETDGGRQWYTSLGHRIEHYSDPVFMRHILGGIEWAAAKKSL